MIIDQNTNFQTKRGGGFKNSYSIDPVTPLHPCRICLSRFSYTYPPTQMILNLCCTKVQIISFISHACVCKKSMIQIYCSCQLERHVEHKLPTFIFLSLIHKKRKPFHFDSPSFLECLTSGILKQRIRIYYYVYVLRTVFN